MQALTEREHLPMTHAAARGNQLLISTAQGELQVYALEYVTPLTTGTAAAAAATATTAADQKMPARFVLVDTMRCCVSRRAVPQACALAVLGDGRVATAEGQVPFHCGDAMRCDGDARRCDVM